MLGSIVDPAEQKEFMIGKTVDAEVLTPDGTVLVSQGQIITASMADTAEEIGELAQLYRAVGGSFAEELNRKVQATTASTQQRLQTVINDSVSAVTNTMVDPVEQQTFVIGKTVDQDIHLMNGTLLIAQGDTVSLAVAELAQEEQILNQVYQAVGGSVAGDLTRRVQETTTATQQQMQGVINQAIATLMSTIIDPEEQKAFVIGKSVDQDLKLPDGTMLVSEGQIVNVAIADQAEQQHVLEQLYRAVGGSFAADLSRRASGVLAGTVIEQTLGRRIQQEVRTGDGTVIAAVGQIVTEPVIDRAKAKHQEAALMTAVGLTPSEAMRSSSGLVVSETSDLLRQGATQVREGADSLWNTVRSGANDLQQQTFHQIEERRIHRALGRPVTRVILDPEDRVILNIGELITHDAIARSRRAGLLDILLSSVHVQKPHFPLETLQAPVPSLAAIRAEPIATRA